MMIFGRRKRMPWQAVLTLLVLAIIALLWAHPSHAQGTPSAGIFDDILNDYMQGAKKWQSSLQSIAKNLFALGAVISLSWTGIRLALKPKEFEGFIGAMVMQVMTLGFFYMLVQQGPSLSGLIITSFQSAGQQASGSGPLSPSAIVTIGFDCLFHIMDAIGSMGWEDTAAFGLPLAFAGIVILLCFVVAAILMLLTFIEAYFVMYGGVLLLGFGSMPWTRDIPKNYLTYAINVGVRIFVLYLVLTIGMTAAQAWPAMVATGAGQQIMHNVFYIFAAAIVFAAVAWKVPGIAGAMTTGAVNMSAADGIGVAAAAGGMAFAGAGIGVAAARAVAGGTMSTVRGATQAIRAGSELAREQGHTGGAAVVRGIGNAMNSASKEVGRSAGAKVGLNPVSANSIDSRNRDITNLGTRAANDLTSQTQGLRETRAGAAVGGQATAGQPAAGAAGASGNPAGSGATAAASSAGAPGSTPAPTPTPTAPEPSGQHQQPSESNQQSLGEAIRSVKPPAMPHDGGGGGVNVNMGAGHED
jgi:type IV secretion system protein TrbL